MAANKITQQVEYYFGDINLPRDKFLQEEMKKDAGWVDLDTMLKFNRLASITTDKEEIAKALEDSELLEVSEDKTKIRRNPEVPLPENTLEYWQEIKRRTVYAKGFPLESVLDDIEQYVSGQGSVKNILMRRFKKEKTFKGSVFITFTDRESAEKFAADEGTKTYKGAKIEKVMQEVYWQNKIKATKEKRTAEKEAKMAKKMQQLAEQDVCLRASHFVKGAVLEVYGLPAENTKYEELKTFFKQYGKVAFVAHESGNTTAQIRFDAGEGEENPAANAWAKAVEAAGEESKVVYKDSPLSARVLKGEEEEKYWSEFSKQVVEKNNRSRHKTRGGQRVKGKRRVEDGGDADEADTKKAKHIVFKDEDEDAEGVKVEVEKAIKVEDTKGIKNEVKDAD